MNNTIKVGIVSDTHGHLDTRIADVIRGCEYAVHAGDIMGAHVLEQLRPRLKLYAVAGNNDHAAIWNSDEHKIVNALPANARFELPGGLIIIEHGHRFGNHPDHDQLRWDHAEARLIVYGHTHKRVVDQSNEPWVVNPGAAGKVRTHGGPSCLVLHASEHDWRLETIIFEHTAAA